MVVTAIDLQPRASSNDDDCDVRVARAKREMGERMVSLGHHYRRDAVSRLADFSGDSLRLSKRAAAANAEYLLKTVTDAEPGARRQVGIGLNLVNRIAVPADVAGVARVTLQRVLDV